MNKTKFSIISSYSKIRRGIGYKGQLPWHNKSDMIHFRKTTKHGRNRIIMGRKTWESLPNPLAGRENVVITRSNISGIKTFQSLDQALNSVGPEIDETFVIGGEQLFGEAIQHRGCKKLILSEIPEKEEYRYDTYFPTIPYHFRKTDTQTLQNGVKVFSYRNWHNPESEEYQYLDLVKRIIKDGVREIGRNGNVRSIFADIQHRFDLRKGFPLLTTKKMPFKCIAKELFFFLRGQTDSNILSKQNVNIWKDNTTREFLDGRGLSYPVGDMGPMYGWNWRHFGAKYRGCHTDYSGKGFDQLKWLLSEIKNNPASRRLMMTTYDPGKVQESVLAPCHGLITQFKVIKDKYLDCKTYQRSADIALGYPFNIASYGLLTELVAKASNLTPRFLTITLGDAHIYESHIEQIKKCTERLPLYFPQLKFNNFSSLETMKCQDLGLKKYSFYPTVKMKMVA
ncbi:thymidylate synthase [Anaeramoeba flamelloides]|uniref:Thymidylate synthase n=1 Tax=Anaeramoeba flamelloides TaxID=1746091 RepID=A0ABQ8Y4L9_9EUKA|nr:thymidylate synthase [Anaeramoeba flamelloides]